MYQMFVFLFNATIYSRNRQTYMISSASQMNADWSLSIVRPNFWQNHLKPGIGKQVRQTFSTGLCTCHIHYLLSN